MNVCRGVIKTGGGGGGLGKKSRSIYWLLVLILPQLQETQQLNCLIIIEANSVQGLVWRMVWLQRICSEHNDMRLYVCWGGGMGGGMGGVVSD